MAYTVIALIFGICFLFIPETTASLIGWAVVDPYVDRIFAAALLAMGWAHFLSSKEKNAEKITIPVQFYFIFDLLGTILSIWAAVTYTFLMGWMLMIIFGLFLVACSIVILKK